MDFQTVAGHRYNCSESAAVVDYRQLRMSIPLRVVGSGSVSSSSSVRTPASSGAATSVQTTASGTPRARQPAALPSRFHASKVVYSKSFSPPLHVPKVAGDSVRALPATGSICQPAAPSTGLIPSIKSLLGFGASPAQSLSRVASPGKSQHTSRRSGKTLNPYWYAVRMQQKAAMQAAAPGPPSRHIAQTVPGTPSIKRVGPHYAGGYIRVVEGRAAIPAYPSQERASSRRAVTASSPHTARPAAMRNEAYTGRRYPGDVYVLGQQRYSTSGSAVALGSPGRHGNYRVTCLPLAAEREPGNVQESRGAAVKPTVRREATTPAASSGGPEGVRTLGDLEAPGSLRPVRITTPPQTAAESGTAAKPCEKTTPGGEEERGEGTGTEEGGSSGGLAAAGTDKGDKVLLQFGQPYPRGVLKNAKKVVERDQRTGKENERIVKTLMIHDRPDVFIIPDMITPSTCDHIIALCEGRWARSKTSRGQADSAPAAYSSTESLSRTSMSVRLLPAETPVVECLESIVAAFAGINICHLEPLLVVKYEQGEFFKEHHDGRFRRKTVLLYLNDVHEGGETEFPYLSLKISPTKGCAVMWQNSLEAGGEIDARVLHAALPLKKGTKYVINCFFNEAPVRELVQKAAESEPKPVSAHSPGVTPAGALSSTITAETMSAPQRSGSSVVTPACSHRSFVQQVPVQPSRLFGQEPHPKVAPTFPAAARMTNQVSQTAPPGMPIPVCMQPSTVGGTLGSVQDAGRSVDEALQHFPFSGVSALPGLGAGGQIGGAKGGNFFASAPAFMMVFGPNGVPQMKPLSQQQLDEGVGKYLIMEAMRSMQPQ